ncbi:MAG: hypothetical protein ACQETH_15355 [Candidatus Rifleibacteriota bacterium]
MTETEINNPAIPPKDSLFMPVEGPQGLRLALVFGNESKDGRCPFFETQCMHCDIGAGEGIGFTHETNARRLAFFEEYFKDYWNKIKHLVIYNYGSTLNPVEFSQETLMSILEFARNNQAISRLSFDCREQFINEKVVKTLVKNTREDQIVSITLGFESQSEEVRITNLKKKMSKDQVEKVYKALATGGDRTAVEMNVLFQPPGVAGNAAVNEAVATIEYGLQLMEKYGVRTDFNFHPYYPSIKGSNAFPDHPRARLEDAIRALILIARTIKKHNKDSLLFVGGNDEGHDLQPSLKQMKQLLYDPAFSAFNLSQDEKDLII